MFAALGLVLVVTGACAAGAPGSGNLVIDSRSRYVIVLPQKASETEKYAAKELRDHLIEISGAALPIVTEGPVASEAMIVVGNGKTAKALGVVVDPKALGEEGFVIKTVGSHLVIAGGGPRGTLYGVYSFLEDTLGCRWYTSWVSRIPKHKTIPLPRLDIAQKPSFEYRDVFYMYSPEKTPPGKDNWDGQWMARQKANGAYNGQAWPGGTFVRQYPAPHTFRMLLPQEKYFKEHPEYYAMVDGKRTGGEGEYQLCMTNPDVLKIVTEGVLKWIGDNKDRSDIKMYFVSQNDGRAYCQCDKCKAINDEEGSPAGALLRFVNAVADEVGKQYPDKLIATLAYQSSEAPPKITKPRPNVRVWLCPVYACQQHPYTQCDYDYNVAFMKRLKGWNAITDQLYIWHYATNFQHYLYPLPNIQELAADIPMYKAAGVKGIFIQGTYTGGGGPAGGAGWMDELKAYLTAKLLWNSKADAQAIIADFLDGYYGRAGKPIGQFLDLINKQITEKNIHAICFDGVYTPLTDNHPAFLTPDIVTQCEQLFDEAERLADDPAVLRRVKHARLGLEYVKLHRKMDVFYAAGAPNNQKAEMVGQVGEFLDRCGNDGIISMCEGPYGLDYYKDITHWPWNTH